MYLTRLDDCVNLFFRFFYIWYSLRKNQIHTFSIRSVTAIELIKRTASHPPNKYHKSQYFCANICFFTRKKTVATYPISFHPLRCVYTQTYYKSLHKPASRSVRYYFDKVNLRFVFLRKHWMHLFFSGDLEEMKFLNIFLWMWSVTLGAKWCIHLECGKSNTKIICLLEYSTKLP